MIRVCSAGCARSPGVQSVMVPEAGTQINVPEICPEEASSRSLARWSLESRAGELRDKWYDERQQRKHKRSKGPTDCAWHGTIVEWLDGPDKKVDRKRTRPPLSSTMRASLAGTYDTRASTQTRESERERPSEKDVVGGTKREVASSREPLFPT